MSDDRPALSAAGLDRLARALEASRELGGLPPDAPRTFGRFTLLAKLGEGRFGAVFLADDPQAGRRVALKLPQAGVMLDPTLARMFRRDAEAAAPLDHPGIVPVLEAGRVGDCPYLVMPHVPGPTLAGWLAAHPGPRRPAEAVDLVLTLAAAVQHANERGVLHCDLKPANVLLSPLGEGADSLAAFAPRVADFGLARLLHADLAATATHAAAGSPPYMSPEQALGRRRDLTAQCDVHALAAILYEMLAGVPTYGRSFEEQLAGLLDRDRRPGRLPGVPRDLEAVVLKGLEKDPAARYTSAAEFAQDLRRWREGRATQARPVGPLGRAWRWARRRPVAAAGVAFLAAALGAVGYAAAERAGHAADLGRARELAAQRDFYARLERVRRRAMERAEGWAGENLADLRALAVMPAARDEQPALRTQAAAALAEPTFRLVRELAPGKDAYVVAFAPDGRTVALGERYPYPDGGGQVRVWLMRAEDGAVERVLSYPIDDEWERLNRGSADGARSMLYAPDGGWLAVGTRTGRAYLWDLRRPAAGPRMMQYRWPGGTSGSLDEIAALYSTGDGGTLFIHGRDPGSHAYDTRTGVAGKAFPTPGGAWGRFPPRAGHRGGFDVGRMPGRRGLRLEEV